MTYINIKNATNKSSYGQISFNNLINGRFNHITKGWTTLKINDVDIEGISLAISGKSKINYSTLIYDYIRNGKSYGIFDRLIFNGRRWEYVTSQSNEEFNTIRKIFREGR